MRALVTGANGFVGRYLLNHLRARGHEAIAAGRRSESSDVVLELDDTTGISHAIEAVKPDAVFHLAAQTFVPAAYDDPLETYETNVMGTARLLDVLRLYRGRSGTALKVLYVSSAQVYGDGNAEHGALREDAPIAPAEPYAASKAAAEDVCRASTHAYGLDVIIARAFNHIGAGQNERFVVASFARQLAMIVHGTQPPLIEVGNLDAERDFLDVRDVVEAYITLAERGVSGEAYNVCSGNLTRVKEILRMLILAANVPVEVREDPEKMRPVDVPQFYGDNSKLRALGWEPQVNLNQSVRAIFDSALNAVTTAV